MTEMKTPPLTARIVPHRERMHFLVTLFGNWFLRGEALVNSLARHHCSNYVDGSWHYVRLSCGGGYLYPTSPERLNVSVSGNQFSGEMSAEAAGIVLTIFALNRLSWSAYDNNYQGFTDKLITEQDRLKDYAEQHPESGLIFRAID
ncbi:antirestriction protein [Serratia quinivorans]|uniref:antirestriction protein n=1 Tax=Serratia quinivorans TaxID=137545 RepID=UPI0034C657FB